jgi:negative regulator of flagellin synthesis FlgM
MKVNQNPAPTPQSVEQSKKTDKAAAARAAANGGKEAGNAVPTQREGVELSDNVRLMQRAEDVAHAAPDVRAERVAALKQSIQDGSYHVDNGSIADRIIEEHLFSGFGKNHL